MIAQNSAELLFPRNSSQDSSPGTTRVMTFEDVQEFLEIPSSVTDPEQKAYCLKRSREMMNRIINRINRDMNLIEELWPNATFHQIYIGYEKSESNIDDFSDNIANPGFKESVNQEIYRRLNHLPIVRPIVHDEDSDEDDESEKSDQDYDFTSEPQPQERETLEHKRNHIEFQYVKAPSSVPQSEWDKWSESKKSAFMHAKDRPNAYYYRHLPEGETQKNGPWTPQEKKLFLARLKELRGDNTTLNGDWGLFSLAIPGRVGYQCSNFYRLLIKHGEVHDSCYLIGEDGKLHHKSFYHESEAKAAAPASKKAPAKKLSTRSKRRKTYISDDEDEEDFISDNAPITRSKRLIDEIQRVEFFRGSLSKKRTFLVNNLNAGNSRYDMWAQLNPIPGAIDSLTDEEMHVPAISDDGYVLDYNTWMKFIKEGKPNPFTRNRLTHRQITVLTIDNYDQYKDHIVNL